MYTYGFASNLKTISRTESQFRPLTNVFVKISKMMVLLTVRKKGKKVVQLNSSNPLTIINVCLALFLVEMSCRCQDG